ncbi:MAG TPA: hypothetical protein VGJ87_05130 [Roseiflexaceae bacterium]|jgi:hypothetical protein
MVTDNSLTPPLLADEARTPNEQAAPLDADTLLQASRRVDWRFLLPDPNLGRVAYIGPARGPQVEALRLFSASLTFVEASERTGVSSAQHDVVVVSDATCATLQWAAELLRPGGWLYVEAYGLFARHGPRHFGWPRFVHDYIVAIERCGFGAVEAYWHWPDFETCLEIIPLGNRAALLYALARRQSSASARLKSALGRWLLRTGLLAQVIPCFSIVAHKQC